MNIFERASRQKLRFPSIKGELTTEQLWDLPLSSRGYSLDSVAKAVNQDLKAVSEESFVSVEANPAKSTYELMLEVVKYIIAYKIAAAEAYRKREANADERQKLIALLNQKNDQDLLSLSKEDLVKRINDLSASDHL